MTSFAGYEGALRASVAAGQLDRVRTRYSLEFEDEGQSSLRQATAETILRQGTSRKLIGRAGLRGRGRDGLFAKASFLAIACAHPTGRVVHVPHLRSKLHPGFPGGLGEHRSNCSGGRNNP
jgi:hypothetical protein